MQNAVYVCAMIYVVLYNNHTLMPGSLYFPAINAGKVSSLFLAMILPRSSLLLSSIISLSF